MELLSMVDTRSRARVIVRKIQIFVMLSGPSLVLKKSCLHKARLGYTPLVEVKQAISAWSY